MATIDDFTCCVATAEQLLERYPYYSALRRMARAERVDTLLSAQRMALPAMLSKIDFTGMDKATHEELIERFLKEDNLKISVEEDSSEPVAQIRTEAQFTEDEDNELLSEQLAEVYESQGLTDQALEIYTKLSLLNPGKFAYFAQKIEKLKNNNQKEE